MNLRLTLCLIICILRFSFSQNKKDKNEIKTLVYKHLESLQKGDISNYIKYYHKNYIHIDPNRKEGGQMNFRKEKKRLKKVYKKLKKDSVKSKYLKMPIDSVINFKKLMILNHAEVVAQFKSIDANGFELTPRDYLVLAPGSRKNRLFSGWYGIYRKIDNKWKVVAGDF